MALDTKGCHGCGILMLSGIMYRKGEKEMCRACKCTQEATVPTPCGQNYCSLCGILIDQQGANYCSACTALKNTFIRPEDYGKASGARCKCDFCSNDYSTSPPVDKFAKLELQFTPWKAPSEGSSRSKETVPATCQSEGLRENLVEEELRNSNNSTMATASNYDDQPEETNLSDQQCSHLLTDGETYSQYKYDDSSWEEEGAVEVKGLVQKTWPQGVELYRKQQSDLWPPRGNHILASYDDNSIVVYQAFCPAIADAAVKDQRFGGGGFSFTRMSWIKTNFLWMMYRCGWATKRNQERVLAVRITLEGFNRILAEALTAQLQKHSGIKECKVRLQWDPDHSPTGGKQARRAIQLGLKDDILLQYSTQWIVSIADVTPYVRYQHRVLKQRGTDKVSTPLERVYTPPSRSLCQRIELG